MPRIQVRDTTASAKRFAERGAAALPDYKAGLVGKGAAWEAAAAGSEDNYNAGVQQAISRNAFQKGVKAAGASYFEQRAINVGGSRFADGIRQGAGNWEEGSKPYLDALKNTELSPRGPKGDPRNMQRASEVAIATVMAIGRNIFPSTPSSDMRGR